MKVLGTIYIPRSLNHSPFWFSDGDIVINAEPHKRINGGDEANGGQVSLDVADDIA